MPIEMVELPDAAKKAPGVWERKHDWESWTNGSAWGLTPGVDFECQVITFRHQCYLEAKRRNLKVTSRFDKKENKLWVQFFALTNAGSPEAFMKQTLEERVFQIEEAVLRVEALLLRVDQSLAALRADVRRAPAAQANQLQPVQPVTSVPVLRNTSLFQFGSDNKPGDKDW